MFEKCWPFPKYEEIVAEFPKNDVTQKQYDIAKRFYQDSITTEAQLLMDFVKKNNQEGEKQFAKFLVRQAVHVALGDLGN